MSKPTPTHSTPASASTGAALHDSGHEQDWWSRLSRTQIDLLKPLASQLFEKLDDALFDRSGSSFQQFFEGMRLLRKNRDALVQAWFDRLEEGWSALRPQAPGAFRPRLVSARGQQVDAGGSAGLSLVDEVTLERKLAVESAIARGASLCRMEVSPLLHRLTLLRKGVEVTVDDLPAAPAPLVQTFAQSLDGVPDLPVEVALVAFKLFDRLVMGSVGVICNELNHLLIRGGVAPQWNWSPPTTPRPPAPRSPASASAAESWEEQSWLETVQALDAHQPQVARELADAAASGFFDERDSGYALANEMDQTRLTASVRALLEHRRLARYNAGRAVAAGQAHYAGNGAVAAPHAGARGMHTAQAAPRALELHTLMEVLASLPPPELPTSWVGDAVEESWDPSLLKDELRRSLDQHGRGGTAAQRGASAESGGQRRSDAADVALGEHEDVIDMVAMMFGFIQKDQALPSAVQALLSRMQLPYLRLALVDPALFSDASHPARALMDRLAEVGKACTPGSPMLAERMLKMHSLVARIVGNHDVSRSFFEGEWQRFRSWSDAIAQRAATREQELAAALAEAEAQVPAGNEADAPEPELAEFLASLEQAANDMLESPVAAAEALPPVPEQTKPQSQPEPPSPVAADAAAGRARLHQIRLVVTAKMRERLEGKVMPEGLRHALSLLWVGHQVRIWQQYGERSYEASSLQRRLDAIIALLDAPAGEQAQADFDRDWPGVERAWSAALAGGPAPAEARARWIGMFRHWADVRTGRAADDPAYKWNWYEGMTAAPAAMTFIEPAARQGGTEGVAPAQPAAAASAADGTEQKPAVAPVARPVAGRTAPARWAVGDWIEFKGEDGAADAPVRSGRGKVTWIGSFTGRTVLVKTDGTLWREESRTDLDDLLDRGLAFIVPRAPLFDRSLQSMFDRLREGVASTLAPAAPT